VVNSLSIVMPAYNEEANIAGMLTDVLAVMEPRFSDLEVVVVNDGSKDHTGDAVRSFIESHPHVRLVEHPHNLGYGAAVYTALTSATHDYVLWTDSDRQFVLEDIDRLTPFAGEADLVVGYRAPRRDPFQRVLFGIGWSTLVTLLFGYTARDIDCAFKLIKREVITKVIGPQVQSRGAAFSAELLVRSKRAGYRIKEVPVQHMPRRAGSPTGARWHVISRAFRELWRFRQQLWRA
jgi:glycosyltransferase involved in cell wall biosynthesis